MATTRRKEMPEAMPAPPYVPPVPLPTRKELVAKFQDKVTEALAAQVEKFDSKALLASVVADLEKQKQAVVLRLLGLDSRWGKYEVDHCNGRKSDITETIAAHCKPVIDAWVIGAIQEELAGLKGKVAEQVRAALKQEVHELIRYSIHDHARNAAETLIAELCEEAKKEMTNVE